VAVNPETPRDAHQQASSQAPLDLFEERTEFGLAYKETWAIAKKVR
jgi:hypothetical protein